MPSSTQMAPAFPLLEARVGPRSSILSVHLADMCSESRTTAPGSQRLTTRKFSLHVHTAKTICVFPLVHKSLLYAYYA